jgi:hypothetical protein
MRVRVCLLLLLTAGAGCGPPALPAMPKPVPVRGKVLLPGNKPLAGGMITFRPVGEPEGRYQGWGFCKSDGTFEVNAFSDPTKGGGVAPGKYKVIIGEREDGEAKGSNAKQIPKIYTEESTTPLTVDIADGENNLPPFVLK